MAGLKLKNFIVDKMLFKGNPNYIPEEDGIEMDPHISVEISKKDQSAVVKIDVEMNYDLENPVYLVEVAIVGVFEYNPEEGEGVTFDELLSSNAIAILYPYVRTIISDLTARSHTYPHFTLPIINVVKMLREEDGIRFVD
ncbi:protein-export chaperone SecB [Staphylococcus sp. 17KM0847]|uniref:protein-export chaperone SecB n=1 Tax=Staphylococcus sp. 17KM0847 TaxID=2583989 RepID=UPI0015DC0E6A|nr:protein-export chaperone SecB [Staphylococcus sp. 17KM0847]QLK86886.1 protein-export chaperone SecB [Staphylococcus sp. 17KM0847]